jgi:hypothetical protein
MTSPLVLSSCFTADYWMPKIARSYFDRSYYYLFHNNSDAVLGYLRDSHCFVGARLAPDADTIYQYYQIVNLLSYPCKKSVWGNFVDE